MRTIIVGGVAGGATVAARLRRNSEESAITIFERGPHISYANCGLPYYIGGVIPQRERLFVQTPEGFQENFKIDVRVNHDVVEIDRGGKRVRVRRVESDSGDAGAVDLSEHSEGEWIAYDKLVLSPGAEPVRPPIPGINDPAIFTLRSVRETDAIKSFIDTRAPRRAVVVGAGFIGLEMAENLHRQGMAVTIVEMADQVMNVVDYEMAAEVHQHLKTKRVEFYLGDGVASFSRKGDFLQITLQSGRMLSAELVILSIGVRPESRLAKEAGLEIGSTGGIVVNSYLQTSDPDVYAVGDAVEFPNPITGKPAITYLAGPANKQGRIVADNIAWGNAREYPGAIGTAVAKVFDLTVATTGASEKTLRRHKVPYKTVITHSSSHAGYYPEATVMTIKTLFDPESGAILGAQIVGYEGVDKRIDLFASVIRSKGTIHDLTELEHAYAPPYSSAKDPVNIAGFVAENVFLGRSRHIHWHHIMGCDLDELFLLDVRTQQEFDLATIEGAVNIPVQELRERYEEIPRNKTLVVFCGIGLRAYRAERILRQKGFEDIYNLSGGYKTYEYATQKQSNEDLFGGDFIHKDDNIYQTDPEAGTGGATDSAPVVGFAIEPIELDASGLQCPGPILALKKRLDTMERGQRVREIATDPGFARDVEAWCRMTGNTLLEVTEEAGRVIATVEKSHAGSVPGQATEKTGGTPSVGSTALDEATIVVFSDSLDRALASFVIANGAASAGKKVTLFFTFWGLSILRKKDSPNLSKDLMGRMFSGMLPKGSGDLGLSKMNLSGMGPRMMRRRMAAFNIDSLEQMMESAVEAGVRLVACQMSMEMMGIKKEELMEGIEIGGVATYLDHATRGNVNLFV